MKKLILIAFMLVPALALADDAATVQAGTKNELPHFTASETLTEQGTVIAVNKKTRDVTILAEGDTLVVNCGAKVKTMPSSSIMMPDMSLSRRPSRSDSLWLDSVPTKARTIKARGARRDT